MDDQTIIVFDTETSGLSPTDSGIIEIAAVAVRGREIIGEFSSLVWPGREKLRPRNRESLRISGITLEMLIDAPEPGDVANRFIAWARTLGLPIPCPCTSHNTAFDRPFLEPWMSGWLEWQACLMLRAMERMEPAGALVLRRDGSWKYPRLSEAALFFGVPRADAHRATGDARTAARIWIALGEL